MKYPTIIFNFIFAITFSIVIGIPVKRTEKIDWDIFQKCQNDGKDTNTSCESILKLGYSLLDECYNEVIKDCSPDQIGTTEEFCSNWKNRYCSNLVDLPQSDIYESCHSIPSSVLDVEIFFKVIEYSRAAAVIRCSKDEYSNYCPFSSIFEMKEFDETKVKEAVSETCKSKKCSNYINGIQIDFEYIEKNNKNTLNLNSSEYLPKISKDKNVEKIISLFKIESCSFPSNDTNLTSVKDYIHSNNNPTQIETEESIQTQASGALNNASNNALITIFSFLFIYTLILFI